MATHKIYFCPFSLTTVIKNMFLNSRRRRNNWNKIKFHLVHSLLTSAIIHPAILLAPLVPGFFIFYRHATFWNACQSLT